MEKVWLKHYPAYIQPEINPNTYESLADFFEKTTDTFDRCPALYNLGSSISYRDLEKCSRDFAAYLQNDLGLKKGDRFGIMLPNVMQYFVVLFGAIRAGLIVVNINPLYTPRELAHQVNDAELQTIIVLANFIPTVQEAFPETSLKHIIVTEVGDMFLGPKSFMINFAVRRKEKVERHHHLPNVIPFKETLKRGRSARFQSVPLTGSDVAFLQYTGGTTGVSKGAMLSHRNILSNIEQAYAWMTSGIQPGKETVITALPLYHIFSLTVNCFVFMKIGVRNILITNPRDIPGLIKEMKKHPVSIFMGVNTLFKALLRHRAFKEVDFSSLKVVVGGGMAVHRAVAQQWKSMTGIPLLEAYGLTETSPAACCNILELDDYNGSIGFPLPSTEIKIVDDHGNELGIGEVGELCIKGPQVMQGYWKKPDETSKVLSDGGWLKTGDISRVDEKGLVYIVDRKKDMFVISGFNVYPSEIEEVIAAHPEVAEVAVVGIPSERTGEYIKAFIVPKTATLTREEVVLYCRDRLTIYKIPKHFEFRQELPKSTVGKILRRTLREEEMAKTAKKCI